jgi:hypothetical protein
VIQASIDGARFRAGRSTHTSNTHLLTARYHSGVRISWIVVFASGVRFVCTCFHGGGSSQFESGYIIPAMGRSPLLPPGPGVDPELRYLQDGGIRMKGSYTAAASGAFVQVEARWDAVRSAP